MPVYMQGTLFAVLTPIRPLSSRTDRTPLYLERRWLIQPASLPCRWYRVERGKTRNTLFPPPYCSLRLHISEARTQISLQTLSIGCFKQSPLPLPRSEEIWPPTVTRISEWDKSAGAVLHHNSPRVSIEETSAASTHERVREPCAQVEAVHSLCR